jgi:hypothetical protein
VQKTCPACINGLVSVLSGSYLVSRALQGTFSRPQKIQELFYEFGGGSAAILAKVRQRRHELGTVQMRDLRRARLDA